MAVVRRGPTAGVVAGRITAKVGIPVGILAGGVVHRVVVRHLCGILGGVALGNDDRIYFDRADADIRREVVLSDHGRKEVARPVEGVLRRAHARDFLAAHWPRVRAAGAAHVCPITIDVTGFGHIIVVLGRKDGEGLVDPLRLRLISACSCRSHRT